MKERLTDSLIQLTGGEKHRDGPGCFPREINELIDLLIEIQLHHERVALLQSKGENECQ
ncbi:hypothetical protein [Thioalkalivibrio denitrificans]|uniref:hypothetical protein n=1 Tax=Thioalkalivibrio denitrificans TaxID=108003 RepID=UPI00158DED7B|nr:hypothetical protein [Thioalkalivibrio denitrificans]